MDIHKNARLTPLGRERMVKQVLGGQALQAVGDAVGICPHTVRKWVKRYVSEGLAGLQDRSSRPRRLYRPTPQPIIERIEALRRQRLSGALPPWASVITRRRHDHPGKMGTRRD